MTTTPSHAALRSAIGGVLLAIAMLLLAAPPASAHDRLLESTPADEAELSEAPDALDLRFSGEVQTIGASFSVVDAAGSEISTGDPALDGQTLSVPITEDLAAGDYEARWRVVSSDGHPISGLVSFSVAGGSGGDSSSTDDAEQSASPTTSVSDEQSSQAAAGEADDSSSEGGSTTRVLLVGALGALAALGLLVLARRLLTRRSAS